jgi:hypothetical protein
LATYCKAYLVKDLRQFTGLHNGVLATLGDDDICYVWPDYTVTKSCLGEKESPLFDVTPQWEDFCKITLGFKVPDDLRGD